MSIEQMTLPETDLEETEEMWYDGGDGILRELVALYTLKDGGVVYVKTSRYRMYDDSDVADEEDGGG